MTPAEQILWQALRGNQLGGYKFRRQQIIHGYIADFYCDTAALVIEIDGSIHDKQAEWDQERQQALELYELRVIRFTNDEVLNDLTSVFATIASYLDKGNEQSK